MTVRWGVAGPGAIADKVMRDLAHVPNAVLTAVGSRSAERVTADLGVRHPVDPVTQSYRPERGDGLLFHLGIYPVSFAQMLLGAPEAVVAHGVLHETGVDVEESVLLRYPGGRSALLFASLRSPAPGEARVLGTTGWIQVPPRFHYPNRILLHRDGHDPETIDVRITGAGYTHELIEVTERVAGGHTESEIMPLADTVAVQDVLGEIADQLGMRVIEGPAELP